MEILSSVYPRPRNQLANFVSHNFSFDLVCVQQVNSSHFMHVSSNSKEFNLTYSRCIERFLPNLPYLALSMFYHLFARYICFVSLSSDMFKKKKSYFFFSLVEFSIQVLSLYRLPLFLYYWWHMI